MSKRWGCGVLTLGVLLTGGGAIGQQMGALAKAGTMVRVAGRVVGAHHEPLTGAVVYCEDDATQQVQTRLTDATGGYEFKRVAGDTDYHVWAAFHGASSKKHFLSKFDSKTEREVDLEVK